MNRRLLAFSTLSLLALYLLPVLLAVPGAITWLQRLDFSGFGSDERLRLWRVAWLLFQDAPLLGQGFRQYGYHYFLANADLPAPRVTGLNDHAHNLVLNVMAEFGLAGLVLLLACAVPWLGGLARQRQTPGTVVAVRTRRRARHPQRAGVSALVCVFPGAGGADPWSGRGAHARIARRLTPLGCAADAWC